MKRVLTRSVLTRESPVMCFDLLGAGRVLFTEVHAAFGDMQRERRHIDLKAIARERLLAAGVARVSDAQVCTICDERFFSYRRESARAGRQAGVAWLS